MDELSEIHKEIAQEEAIKEGIKEAFDTALNNIEYAEGTDWIYRAIKEGTKEAILELKK